MAKRIVARRTRAERRSVRTEIGRISDNLVLSSTLKRYKAAFDTFQAFLHGLGPRRRSQGTSEYIDEGFAEFLEHLWQEGEGIAVANYTLASILHFAPKLGPKLPCARRIIKGWRKLELPTRACPLSLDMALAICGVLLVWDLPRLSYVIHRADCV